MMSLIGAFNGLSRQITRILSDVTGTGHYYHCTFQRESEENVQFLPLSHFTNLAEAKENLSNASAAQKSLNPGRIIETRLNIKNPLRLNDIDEEYDFNAWRKALEKKLPGSLLNYIFERPFAGKPLEELKNELAHDTDGIFDAENIPDIQACQTQCSDNNTANCVVIKRLIKTLESFGYDGVEYQGKNGSHNFVVFNPETQVTVLTPEETPFKTTANTATAATTSPM